MSQLRKHNESSSNPSRRERGVALIVALTAVAILAAFLADMHETTNTAYMSAIGRRDALRAEYLAKSGVNLTRLLIANEPAIRKTIEPLLKMVVPRTPAQLPVWQYANEILALFADFEGSKSQVSAAGFDMESAEGLGDYPGGFQVIACAENRKLNVNNAATFTTENARKQVALQLFTLLGGYQTPNEHDEMFNELDPDEQTSRRLDIVSSLIDWWDFDQQLSSFDPGDGEISVTGSEDDVYSNFVTPYDIKNAPFDSVEEIRMIRGIGDEFFAKFVRPDPLDTCQDLLTVYGGGNLNPNEARPEAMLARVCSFLKEEPLCSTPEESSKFIQLVHTVRAMAPLPWFPRATDFLTFLEGKGKEGDLYPMLKSFLGEDNPLLFQPVTIEDEKRKEMLKIFDSKAKVFSIQVTGKYRKTRTRIRSVVIFDKRWTAPPPSTTTMGPLGIAQYWRVD